MIACTWLKPQRGGVVPVKEPKKETSHIPGELVMATGDLLNERVARFSTLLNSISGAAAVILSPLPRNMEGPCCSRSSHMPGYQVARHKQRLLEMLDVNRRNVKDALYLYRIRGIQSANYARTIMEHGWRTPTAPNSAGYAALLSRILSEGVAKQLASRSAKDKRPPNDSGATTPSQKKGHVGP